ASLIVAAPTAVAEREFATGGSTLAVNRLFGTAPESLFTFSERVGTTLLQQALLTCSCVRGVPQRSMFLARTLALFACSVFKHIERRADFAPCERLGVVMARDA